MWANTGASTGFGVGAMHWAHRNRRCLNSQRPRTRVIARRPRGLIWSRPLPQLERDWNGIDVDPRPPRRFVAVAMEFAMVRATDGDRVFVADLPPERAGLRKAKMMRVRRGASAYDARLPGDEFTMFLVAQANGL